MSRTNITSRFRALARWIIRGERNVTTTLDSLSVDIRQLQRRLDVLESAQHQQHPQHPQHPEHQQHPPADEPDPQPAPDPWLVADHRSPDGVNVVGYLQHQLSLGDSGRRMCELVGAAGITTSPIAFTATASPLLPQAFPTVQRIDNTNTIAVVAADQLPVLHRDHPEVFAASERMVGYCFWEVSTVSAEGRRGVELVDEVWACTRFIADAFERLGTVAVRHVPITIAEPAASTRPRASFEPLADADDRIVFGVTFDHFSVMERKNPVGAIEAFRRAFPTPSEPLLVVKTLNADLHPETHARLVAAAAGRPDIVVWDAHLSRADQLAFISQLDVLVSIHRGEGLGVHLAEAMWLGVPVVATRYSGNLDFMDDTSARLVGQSLIPVEGGGSIYPEGAQWADPDVGDAADGLAALASSPELRASLGRAAQERMRSQPDDRKVGTTIADALGIATSGPQSR